MQTDGNIKALDECRFSSGMGTINASGVIKNIRGSKLSVSEIFLREAVQNSYDARLKDSSGKSKVVNFSMRAFHFTDEQFENLQNILDKEQNPSSFYRKYLKRNLTKSMLNIEVSDTNTTGLRGETEPTDTIENQNFADFVYSTGSKKLDDNTGGTFGFGKAALYAYSQARTIAVYTRISSELVHDREHTYQSRFIIISNDERITDTKSDRCWWGIKKERSIKDLGTYASPVIGENADRLAASLGMIQFTAEETGTKILVLNAGPDELPEDIYGNKISADEIFKDRMPYYIIHWYWNKILYKSINFCLQYENEIIEIDDPRTIYPYGEFCKAYKKFLEHVNNKKFAKTKTFACVDSERPKVRLGYTSISNTPVMRIRNRELFSVFSTDEPVIAYMRGIGHIVYYDKVKINSEQIEQTCYGIFRTDKSSAPDGEEKGAIDKYFTNIENQTHDRWEHRDEQFKRNYLKTVLRDVEELVRNNCSIQQEEQKSADISIMIQRTLGAKLMPYIANIGGAKAPVPNDVQPERKTLPDRCSFLQTGKTDISIENGKKVFSSEYKVKISDGKKISVKSISPGIKLLDSSEEIIDETQLKFLSCESVSRDGTTLIYKQDKFEIIKSQNLTIKIACYTDVSFDIKIDWEEVDA